VPLIDTQTGAIEVGHTRPAFKPHIIIEACSLPVRGIVLGLYSVALVVGQAPVLMTSNRFIFMYILYIYILYSSILN
jgi:hypothetical protein